MDSTANDMVFIVRNSDNQKRIQDAVDTLLGILPSLDGESVESIISDMSYIIRNSDEDFRRRFAQQLLIMFKNAQGLR
ncbi:MAG: hypothetical protein PVJ57_11875 [Phycisphaerae bacterium]|jgi:hypothetical protein